MRAHSHGTFSSSRDSLNEYAATDHGRKFLSDAIKHYKGQVLVFDHPTRSVSPFINGLVLARRRAGTSGSVDIIAHSRGGLVVRWWLEVLGDSLAGANVRGGSRGGTAPRYDVGAGTASYLFSNSKRYWPYAFGRVCAMAWSCGAVMNPL